MLSCHSIATSDYVHIYLLAYNMERRSVAIGKKGKGTRPSLTSTDFPLEGSGVIAHLVDFPPTSQS
jgi:hypothetical protein